MRFLETYQEKGAKIPEEKIPEFRKRLEKLFQAGGMMQAETVSFQGHTCHTIRMPSMGTDGMRFNFNYFEEDFWDEAGFDVKENCIWSDRIGWGEFASVLMSAHMLEALIRMAPRLFWRAAKS
ncbi:MAG: hypothetical protein LIP12_00975 [Clostridiales bacterium]|nr:hypothetical protein [Clostridiales bacterium]